MSTFKCPLATLGAFHIVDGIVNPAAWGISWLFYGYVSTVAAPVWGGVVFFIPAGILTILAGTNGSRGVANWSLVMNIFAGIVAVVVIVFSGIMASTNFSYGLGAHGACNVISILSAALEIVISIMGAIYSGLVISRGGPAQTTTAQAPTLGYNIQAVQQYPGQQFQAQQYPGQQVQAMQYPGQQAQAMQYPAAPQEQTY
ncbi:uncharacterized protein LOC110984571 [Acanthaster planci]|uniref:Uncharacterized protein LOC110984571 n=1 Tax=Acanthaster planci TaxID=133434 RepID=A0A8B7Z712_ACAPL|nr:uncharacterized protein LOC110984571 [Acanthaster planci]XP_022100581.1 uncharacterized protein LOC110984571 [Acanthaster planci]